MIYNVCNKFQVNLCKLLHMLVGIIIGRNSIKIEMTFGRVAQVDNLSR